MDEAAARRRTARAVGAVLGLAAVAILVWSNRPVAAPAALALPAALAPPPAAEGAAGTVAAEIAVGTAATEDAVAPAAAMAPGIPVRMRTGQAGVWA